MVSKEVEGILLGMPGMEMCGIDLISSKRELHFPNGAKVNYITKRAGKVTETPQARAIATTETKVIHRRILLQAPSSNTWINPGETITLTTKPGSHMTNGKCLIKSKIGLILYDFFIWALGKKFT